MLDKIHNRDQRPSRSYLGVSTGNECVGNYDVVYIDKPQTVNCKRFAIPAEATSSYVAIE